MLVLGMGCCTRPPPPHNFTKSTNKCAKLSIPWFPIRIYPKLSLSDRRQTYNVFVVAARCLGKQTKLTRTSRYREGLMPSWPATMPRRSAHYKHCQPSLRHLLAKHWRGHGIFVGLETSFSQKGWPNDHHRPYEKSKPCLWESQCWRGSLRAETL